MRNRIRRILEKIEAARERKLSCFGSDRHQFRMNPCLSEAEVSRFEDRLGIRLPEGYREFVLHAGNGGAGPYYGIYGLVDPSRLYVGNQEQVSPDVFRCPCPLHPGMDRGDDWQAQFRSIDPYQGTIAIGTQGCSYEMLLVVSGQHAGRVVYGNLDFGAPVFVPDADYLDWYERWLDELLAGYDRDWFGFVPGGSEQDHFRTIDDRTATPDARASAAAAIRRLPGLSSAGRDRIRDLLHDSNDQVRAHACGVAGKFKLVEASHPIAKLLDDPSADVRHSAIANLVLLDPSRSADVRHLLNDPDEKVATSAYFKLSGKLSKSDLLGQIVGSKHQTLRGYAAHSAKWDQDDVPFLIELLRDPNSMVRFYATLGIRQLKAWNAVPHVMSLLDHEPDDLVIGSCLKMLGESASRDAADCLLQWTRSGDDFHRMDAIEALSLIGDDRGLPVARDMLREDRRPCRDLPRGQSHTSTIGTLVKQALSRSPHSNYRTLGTQAGE